MRADTEQRRLFILDDDAAVGEVIGRLAESEGLAYLSTTSATEFFEAFSDGEPSHVALDLIMPDTDGIEVLRQLAERQCKASIILTSGVGTRILDAARRSAEEHGLTIAGVLPKPFSAATLRSLLSGEVGGADAAPFPSRAAAPAFEVTEAALQEALEDQHMRVVFQPKIELGNGVPSGFEALVRWHHPEAGLIAPDRFIPLAERTGQIDPLTDQILAMSFDWFSTHFGKTSEILAVNISAQTLADFELADRVVQACHDYGLSPDRIILELTETYAMSDPMTTLDVLTRLRMKGFRLSIDDFGVGYSSLVQLARLPFSELKVDRLFVGNAMESLESRTIINAVVCLGHSLGLNVTAEGVEDAGTLEFLRDLECDFAQGYYIARPMPGDAVVDWASQRQPFDAVAADPQPAQQKSANSAWR